MVPDQFVPKTILPITAVRLTSENLQQVANWCGGEIDTKTEWASKPVRFPTLYGVGYVAIGEWLIRDEHGKFSAMPNRQFRDTYRWVPHDSEGASDG